MFGRIKTVGPTIEGGVLCDVLKLLSLSSSLCALKHRLEYLHRDAKQIVFGQSKLKTWSSELCITCHLKLYETGLFLAFVSFWTKWRGNRASMLVSVFISHSKWVMAFNVTMKQSDDKKKLLSQKEQEKNHPNNKMRVCVFASSALFDLACMLRPQYDAWRFLSCDKEMPFQFISFHVGLLSLWGIRFHFN